MHHTTHTIDGFTAHTVSTGPLELTIIPELGGKISSLRDTRSGREWLWRHPRMPYRRVEHGGSYTALADTGGWDECFPSVAPCAYPGSPWAGAAVQDHGELWSQACAWEATTGGPGGAGGAAPADLSITTRWKGVVLPYSLTRTITLREGAARLRIDYEASTAGNAPLHFIWCAHPLLAIEPGMRLRFPDGARFHCWTTIPAEMLRPGESAPPQAAPLFDYTNLPIDPNLQSAITNLQSVGVALKLWSEPLDQGWAALEAADGALHMRWDMVRLPQVAAWINLGAWAGDGGAPYYNLGLEPCIGAQDSLEEAITVHRLHATIPPKGAYTWWLEVELTAV